MEKKPITIVLTKETHAALVEMAKKESRPVAQMARVIIERETANFTSKNTKPHP